VARGDFDAADRLLAVALFLRDREGERVQDA
jgi:hypothetical protein